MTKIPLADQIAEIKRELAMRAAVYPAQVAKNKLSQERADAQISRMTATLDVLEWLERNQSLIKAVKRFEDDKAMDAVRSVFPDAEVSIK